MAVTDTEGKQATTVEDKVEIVKKTAFLHPPDDPVSSQHSMSGIVIEKVDREAVSESLYDQVQTKTLCVNGINV